MSSSAVLSQGTLILVVLLITAIYDHYFLGLSNIVGAIKRKQITVYNPQQEQVNYNIYDKSRCPPGLTSKYLTNIFPSWTCTNISANFVNDDDSKILQIILSAYTLLEQRDAEAGLKQFEKILTRFPKSGLAWYGKAQAMELLAEQTSSNYLYMQSIDVYKKLMNLNVDLPSHLYITIGIRLSEIYRYMGEVSESFRVIKLLSDKFPDNLDLIKRCAQMSIETGKISVARQLNTKILEQEPKNGKVLLNQAFAVKALEADLDAITELVKRAITDDPDSVKASDLHEIEYVLLLQHRDEEIPQYLQLAVDKGYYPSVVQRSFHNVDHLTARPIWTMEETGAKEYLQLFVDNWETIRDEALQQMEENNFKLEHGGLRDRGIWTQYPLFMEGRRYKNNCDRTPKTCALIQHFKRAVSYNKGEILFSAMYPGIHLWPHTSATNHRLRAHLTLKAPHNGPFMRVIDQNITWKEGTMMIFDDSFEHEVTWEKDESDTDSMRLILILDFWHPELIQDEIDLINMCY